MLKNWDIWARFALESARDLMVIGGFVGAVLTWAAALAHGWVQF